MSLTIKYQYAGTSVKIYYRVLVQNTHCGSIKVLLEPGRRGLGSGS